MCHAQLHLLKDAPLTELRVDARAVAGFGGQVA
jgi:hypothetical protein